MGSEYQKWMIKLLGYDFLVVYNPDKSNGAADAFSRRPHEEFDLGALLISNGIDWEHLDTEV